MTDAKKKPHDAAEESLPIEMPFEEDPKEATEEIPPEDAEDMELSYADDPAWENEHRIREAKFAARSAALARSCAKTAAIYPEFDLKKEMRNPRFLRLIDAGLSVRESYEVLHRDELLRRAVEAAAENARREAYAKLASRKNRVEENGASPALVTRKNPASMSKSQREQIAKRVMRGEKVTF